jgi:ornithine carbamoyltransferase
MDVRIASPTGYGLAEWAGAEAAVRANSCGGSFRTTESVAEALQDADVAYTDTWTSMGFEREAERRRMDFAGYQLNHETLESAAPGALVMHDLPAHRGEEITDEVFESAGSIIFDQAENRTWAQVAVIAFLLGVADAITP